jgi:predicted transposase/invertase (TIGR01784 family)
MNEENNYVKATSDIFIKYMFGMDTKQSNHLVLSFINSVLGASGFPTITKVIQKNPYNYRKSVKGKETVLDIRVSDENHKLYNIEMQASGDSHFRNRAVYYWSKSYVSQIEKGDDFEKLLPTIGINILNFTLFPELPAYHNFFMIIEGKDKKHALTDHLTIHFLEIPKIEDREISSKIIGWLLYLKSEGQDKDMIKILLESDEDLQAAHEMYEAFNRNDELREYALAREKYDMDNLHRKNMARKKGRAEGRAEGREKGLAEGLEKGQEKGELKKIHSTLIRLLELKYTLSEDEKNTILSVTDSKKLDAAVDAVMFAEDKESVLRVLTGN